VIQKRKESSNSLSFKDKNDKYRSYFDSLFYEGATERLLSIRTKIGADFTTGKFFIKEHNSRDYIFKSTQKGSISDNVFLSHFTGDNTIACYRFVNSKIYIIDIDQRSQSSNVKTETIRGKVISLIGKPFFEEFSDTSQGYHLYYEFIDYISDTAWKDFETLLYSDYGFVIEIVTRSKQFRLPFSVAYRKTPSDMKEFDEFINSFSSHLLLEVPKILKGKFGFSLQVEKKEKIEKDSLSESYTYGCGTRWKSQIRLALYAQRNNLSYMDYLALCEQFHNGTSKDVLSQGMEKCILPIWKWSETIEIKYNNLNSIENNTTSNYVVNEDYSISNNIYSLFNNLIIQYLSFQLHNDKSRLPSKVMNKVKTLTQEKKQTEIPNINYVRKLRMVYEHACGKSEYRKSKKYRYMSGAHKHLEKGVPIGIAEKRKVGEFFGIKNIEHYYKILEDIGLLQLIKNDKGYSYSYKGVRHVQHYYVVNDEAEMNKLIHSYVYVNKQATVVIEETKKIDLGGYNSLYERLKRIQKNKMRHRAIDKDHSSDVYSDIEKSGG